MSKSLGYSVAACDLTWPIPWSCWAQVSPSETIAFTTLRPANHDIYLMDAPGSEPRRMTHHPGLAYNPVFSPNGRWLVFTSERNGNVDLYALDLMEGSGPVRLTNDKWEDGLAGGGVCSVHSDGPHGKDYVSETFLRVKTYATN